MTRLRAASSLALALAVVPLSGFCAPVAADYFVRANMLDGGLSIDDATSISGTNSGAFGSSATGSADLKTGQLRAFADANDPSNTISANVDFGDTITVLGLMAPTTVTLQMRVTGTLGGTYAQARARLTVGDSLVCSDVSPVCGIAAGVVGNAVKFWETPTSSLIDEVLSVSRQVSPENATFSFFAALQSAANGPTGVSDFGNTATMDLLLPSGLSFISASGVFLTAPSSVPEPSALALVLMGMPALLAAQLRRLTRQRAPTVPIRRLRSAMARIAQRSD